MQRAVNTQRKMASIQDIQALEQRIYDAVEEYINNPDGYDEAVLHVYLNEDDMEYFAEVDNASHYTSGEEVYPINKLIRFDENGESEVDVDAASDIANSWIFLD